MSDRPDRDPFEEELREALRSGTDRNDPPSPTEDSDDLLRRIRSGVARRRARRRAGVFLATAATVAAITVVVPLLSPTPPVDEASNGPARETGTAAGGRADIELGRMTDLDRAFDAPANQPRRSFSAAPPLQAGQEVKAEAVQVSSVSGSSEGEYWLSASATCGQRLCNVLGHAGESEPVSFIALPGDARRTETKVRFSGDGEIGWATNGKATYRTVNGGHKWIPLRPAAGVEVEAMEAWGDEVWLVGHRSTRSEPVVLNDAPASGGLRELPPPDGVTPRPDLAVALSDGSLGMPASGSESSFVYTVEDGTRWEQSPIGCEPASLSATGDAIWALCDYSTPTLVKSLDLGHTWESPQAVVDLALTEPTASIAAVSDDTAFVTSGSRAWVVESSVSTPVTGLGDGPYVYAGFTSENVGYVIDNYDSLYRTDNGGHNWAQVDLP